VVALMVEIAGFYMEDGEQRVLAKLGKTFPSK
jgi:hypothetical protein